MTRWTAADLATANTRMREWIAQPMTMHGEEIVDRRRSKYRNERAIWQGHTFDSKRELEKFKEFELLRVAGKIRSCVRQVSFQLPGTKRRIRIDFLVVRPDGSLQFFDAKGFETSEWRLKRQQVFDAYGITINLI